jgi:hypothetical protein
MIITLTRANFSACNIGTLTTVNVKSTVSGTCANVVIKMPNVEKAGYTTATTIATISLNTTNYKDHNVKVMMGSTDVSSWYSSGNVIVPANTPITSNITIYVSATAVVPDEPAIPPVEPEEPGTGGSGDNVHSNVSYITRVTNNVNIVDSKSVGPTGGYNEDQNYLSYEYTIPYNGTIYFDPSTTSTYIALWYSGTNTRYRKSENNLPSQENSLAVTAGDRIIATLTKGTASSFKLVYNNELGSTYTEQLIVSKSDMTIHKNQTAGANGLTASESYNSWELDFDGKEFEKGYLYMSDFTTAYTAILILSVNGNVRYRVTSGEDTLPKDIQTIVPVTSNDTIYVSENKTNSKEFKIHFLTED